MGGHVVRVAFVAFKVKEEMIDEYLLVSREHNALVTNTDKTALQ